MPMGVVSVAALLSPLLLAVAGAQPPLEAKNFQINKHVTYEAEKTPEGGLHVHYLFKDHTETPLVFDYTYDYQHTLDMISRFGLPNDFFRPYYPAELSNRLKIIDNAMFTRHNKDLSVDLSRVATFYSDDFGKPIADFIIASLRQRNIDTRTDRIAMAMAFIQDIPYGVPEFNDGVTRAGVSPAPLILLSGFGDCDSKTAFFVGILRHLINPEDILFLEPQDANHTLSAIRGDVTAGRWTITHEEHTFVLADTAGPGRLAFGEKGGEQKSRTHTIRPYVNSLPPFHADADYSNYGKVFFIDPYGKVSFRGATSQEPVQSGGERVAQAENDEAFTTSVALDEGGKEGEEAGGDGPQHPAEKLGGDDAVAVSPLVIRYGSAGSLEVHSSETNSIVALKCGEVVTLRMNGGSNRIQLLCGDDSSASAGSGHEFAPPPTAQ